MRIVEAPCKFCKKPLHLEVDEAFLEMRPDLTLSAGGKVVSLLNLSACNRCADYQSARIRVVGAIKKKCLPIIGCKLKPEMVEKYREWFTLMVKRYMRITADFLDVQMPDWDDEIVSQILDQPGNYGVVLSQVYRTFKQPVLI